MSESIQVLSPAEWPQLDPAEQFLQVGQRVTLFPGDRALAREQFRRHRAIHLADLLEPSFLALVLSLCESGGFQQESPGSGSPEVEHPQRVGRLLDAAFQRSVMLRWMEEVTGCEPLHTFAGRLTQTRAQTGERRRWHDDLVENDKRRLALVLNLSPEPYQGGAFQLRLKTGERIFRHQYQRVGEAILFLVDPALQHNVQTVFAGGPRRVFAGWGLAAGASR